MTSADLKHLAAKVRAAAEAGQAEDAFRLAFQAVQASDLEQSSTRAALAMATEGQWDQAIERVNVFAGERDRFVALAALLILTLVGESPGEAGRDRIARAEQVLRAIEELPTGGYDPIEDFDPALVFWLAGRACDLGLTRPERILAALPDWYGEQAVDRLLGQITGERPKWARGELALPTSTPVRESRGARERLELAEHLTEGVKPSSKHGRGIRGRCWANIGRVFAALGHANRAAELLTRALEETSLLDTEEFCDDTFDREPCVTAISRGCAALGGEGAAALLLGARREADRIDHPGWKGSAFKSLALAAARIGDPEAAGSLLQGAFSPDWVVNPGHGQAELLVAIALAWAQRGARERASKTLVEAWEKATQKYDPEWRKEWERSGAMLGVAAGWAELGHQERALECLALLHDDGLELDAGFHRAMVLRALAEAHDRLGRPQRARELLSEAWAALRSDNQDILLPDGCAVLATDWLRLGDTAQAIETLNVGLDAALVSALDSRHCAPLMTLLGVCGELGAPEGRGLLHSLLERALSIPEVRTRTQVISGIAVVHARLGDSDRATNTLLRAIRAPRPAPTTGDCIRNLAAVAEAHRRRGDFAHAEAAVRSALKAAAQGNAPTQREGWARAVALEKALEVAAGVEPNTARLGLLEHAMELLVTLAGSEQEVGPCLEAVVGGCVQLADPASAARLIERALSLDPHGWVMGRLACLVEPCGALGPAALPVLVLALEIALHGEADPKFEHNRVRQRAVDAVLEACVKTGDLTLVRPVLEQAIAAASAPDSHVWSDPGTRATALLAIAKAFARLGDQSSGEDLLKQAVRLASAWREGDEELDEIVQSSAKLRARVDERKRLDLGRIVPLQDALGAGGRPLPEEHRKVVASARGLGLDARFFSAVASAASHLTDSDLRQDVLQAIEASCMRGAADDDCTILCAAGEAWASAGQPARAIQCLQRAVHIALALDSKPSRGGARAWALERVSGACASCADMGVDLRGVLKTLFAAQPSDDDEASCWSLFLAALPRCARQDPALLVQVATRSASFEEEYQLRRVWTPLCDAALATGSEAELIPLISGLRNGVVRLEVIAALAEGIGKREDGDLRPLLSLLGLEPGERSATLAIARAALVVASPHRDKALVASVTRALDLGDW